MKPHQPPDPFAPLSDEAILLLIRYNVPAARSALLLRHLARKNTHFRRAIPEYAGMFDSDSKDDIFFRSFQTAEVHYRFRAARFERFFEIVLRREALKEAIARFRDSARSPFSLDDELDGEEALVFHDVLPTGRIEDDPKAFLSYAEGLLAISKLPKGIRAEAVRIVRHVADGDGFEEASRKEGVTMGSARGMVYRYRLWAKETLEKLGRTATDPKNNR